VFLGTTAIIHSAPMVRLLDVVQRVARSNATVLIAGESGVGKEVIARAIHYHSARAQKPWVDVSCAALPDNLLESELFGHERGAFTGAASTKPGLFELADKGTIFLDEIGELEARMQVKLLRVLDGVPYYRLGGVRKVTTDVRVVAATNQDLEKAVIDGRFRGDLYHRLSQFTVVVPPLRARVGDVAALARHFLDQHDPNLTFTDSAIAMLENHVWPGNVRELRNTVIQAAVMASGRVIGVEDLHVRPSAALPVPPPPQLEGGGLFGIAEANGNGLSAGFHNGGSSSTALPAEIEDSSLDGMERRMIFDALRATGGHQQRAAERLGISRRTLSRKLKAYETEFSRAAG
jgi:transcriptional regulator with GAF, ATPase, and Fis domain